jgi:flavin reductase (DIM6/NTAB) family NADH-FMN oxidoreductase RutF
MTQQVQKIEFIKLEKEQFSRLLYPNPVCLLTSYSKEFDKHNIMTISWLTAIDNDGRFLCSMNQKRSSAELVLKSKQFILNVPIKGMESLVDRMAPK